MLQADENSWKWFPQQENGPQSICAQNQQVAGPQSGEHGGLWNPEHLLDLHLYDLLPLTGSDD